jgi:hypothetical protein
MKYADFFREIKNHFGEYPKDRPTMEVNTQTWIKKHIAENYLDLVFKEAVESYNPKFGKKHPEIAEYSKYLYDLAERGELRRRREQATGDLSLRAITDGTETIRDNPETIEILQNLLKKYPVKKCRK